MGYAEKRTDRDGHVYYRARYKIETGKPYGTIKDVDGNAVRYRTSREAKQAANDKEAEVRADLKKKRRPLDEMTTFGEWANRWYAAQDLAPSTMANYKRRLENHLLPHFEDWPLADIRRTDVDAWERKKREAGYSDDSIRSWRNLLHTIMGDATDEVIDYNPVTKKRGRGKRAGRSASRAPEKAITDPLGALLIAERAAIMSGRDDEFVLVITGFYTGMRWGELVGLETRYARLGSIRVEWQICEIDGGELVRQPPKDDSYRDVDTPPFLSKLISEHVARIQPKPCACHGYTHVFRGLGSKGAPATVSIADVAKRARVAVGTVSNVLNHPERVAEKTRTRVLEVIEATGFTPGRAVPGGGHWRRSSFAAWVFHPAVSGMFPPKDPLPERPVPLLADPWPGRPARGRGAQERAELCWLPIEPDLTPHGLKHSHKSLMIELRTPEVLSHERLGHEMGGIGGVYSHVTPAMRAELLDGLGEVWERSLDSRLSMHARSPVAVLDALLRARARKRNGRQSEDRLPEFSPEGVSPLRAKPVKGV